MKILSVFIALTLTLFLTTTVCGMEIEETHSTPMGKLQIVRVEDFKHQIKLNDSILYQDEESMGVGVVEKFNLSGGKLALFIGLGSGGTGCPSKYIFITLAPNAKPIVSKVFGTCSDIPDCLQKGDSVEIKMPKYNPMKKSKGTQRYVYQNGNVKEMK